MNDVLEPAVEAPEVHSYAFPLYNLAAFTHLVDIANRRFERARSEARFNFSYEPFDQQVRKGMVVNDHGVVLREGYLVVEPWVRASMEGPLRIGLAGWTFVASLVAEEGGIVVHSVPGQELGGYEPKGDDSCDHCKVNRRRNRLYLVRNDESGEIIQLGHSCIEIFLGAKVHGLWGLLYDAELSAAAEGREGGFSDRDYGVPIDSVIAVAWAYSNKGRNYVSVKRAEMLGTQPTGSKVRSHIFYGRPARHQFPKDWRGDEAYDKAVGEYDNAVDVSEDALADDELMAAIKASAEDLPADSDYGRNMRVLLNGEYVSGKNVGILASLVAVYARQLQLAAERAAAPEKAKGFLGEVKERIRSEIVLNLTQVREREGDYGYTTWFVGETPDHHVAVWNASGRFDAEVGDTLVLSAASVKAHEVYKGIDQTILTRAKVAEIRKP
jgi:hypothetical protein